MRTKHYPNTIQMLSRHRALRDAVDALGFSGIEVRKVDLPKEGQPVIEVYNCPNNYYLHGVHSGTGIDRQGPFVRKETQLGGCKVIWTEAKP